MTKRFDFAVVGRGLMGSAAARHLSDQGLRVAIIGPDEPADRQVHNGPFASHHDAGRVTRHLSPEADWSRLATRSIARYAEIEVASGIKFYTPCGAIVTGGSEGPGGDYADRFYAVAEELDLPHERLSGPALADRFPYLSFVEGTRNAYEENGGGYINPRLLRDAQTRAAEVQGAVVYRDHVTDVSIGPGPLDIRCAGGATVSADQVIMATGAYAKTNGLLPRRPTMTVYARTIAFSEVNAAEREMLAGMPTAIIFSQSLGYTLYVMPPIQYPDGKWYVKIGGEDDGPTLSTDAEMTAWFRTPGNPQVGAQLLDHLRGFLPGLRMQTTHTDSCAITHTATDYPYIARISDRMTLLTGGNGASAKSSDELGRLGALIAQGQTLDGQGYDRDFHAVFDSPA
jgi:sarcosine oxidase